MDPILWFFAGAFLLVGAGLTFQAGRHSAQYPTEEAMMERLIVARTERMLLGVAKKSIEAEVADESNRRVQSATGDAVQHTS